MSTTKSNEQLQTIDSAALAQVSGGATTTATTTSSDQVMTALTGILESIQSLATQRDTGGFNQQEMLMLMMMMQQRNQQQAVAVSASSWPWSQEPIVRYY
jgi:hypothetical protein